MQKVAELQRQKHRVSPPCSPCRSKAFPASANTRRNVALSNPLVKLVAVLAARPALSALDLLVQRQHASKHLRIMASAAAAKALVYVCLRKIVCELTAYTLLTHSHTQTHMTFIGGHGVLQAVPLLL